jgi:hypothetical protein
VYNNFIRPNSLVSLSGQLAQDYYKLFQRVNFPWVTSLSSYNTTLIAGLESFYLYGNKVIDNTFQAIWHYYFGNGEPVELGPNTINAFLKNNQFKYHHQNIINGITDLMSGNFPINFTMSIENFHLGKTTVNYSIECTSSTCTVNYDLFVNDGFWDPNSILERITNSLWPKGTPCDELGPRLELGGNPYPYVPAKVIFTFPNPGY